MTSIILNSITGLNYPYDIYVCDVYGNNCGYISQINTPVPSSVEIVLPPPFNVAPAVGIKIITSDGCERFNIYDCIYITPSTTPTNTPTPSITPTITPTPTITQTPTPTNSPPTMCFSYYALDYSGSTMFQCEVTADGTLYNGKKWWSLTGCPTNNVIWGGGPCPFSGYVWWDGFSGWRYTELLGGGSGLYYCYLNNPGDYPVQVTGLYEWVTTGMFTCVPTILNSYTGPCIPVTSTPTPTPSITPTATYPYVFDPYVYLVPEPQDTTSLNDLSNYMYSSGSTSFLGWGNGGVPSISGYSNDLNIYIHYSGFTGGSGNFVTNVSTLKGYIKQTSGTSVDTYGCTQDQYTFNTIELTTSQVNTGIQYFYTLWIPLNAVGGTMTNMTVDIGSNIPCSNDIGYNLIPDTVLASADVVVTSGAVIPSNVYRVLWIDPSCLIPSTVPPPSLSSSIFFKGNTKT